MREERNIIFSTQFDLEKHLIKWMDILELNDWEIKIKFNINLKSLGETTFQTINKQARIHLLSYAEFSMRDFDFNWDMEETLVHELLHIKFSYLMHSLPKMNDAIDFFEECLVEELARIYIKMDRRNEHVPSGKEKN